MDETEWFNYRYYAFGDDLVVASKVVGGRLEPQQIDYMMISTGNSTVMILERKPLYSDGVITPVFVPIFLEVGIGPALFQLAMDWPMIGMMVLHTENLFDEDALAFLKERWEKAYVRIQNQSNRR